MVAAAEVAPFFQRRNQPVNARLRFQQQRVLHLLEAGGKTRLFQVFVDVDEQLVLLAGKHDGFPPKVTRNKAATSVFYVSSQLSVKHNLWKTSTTALKAERIQADNGNLGTGG